MSSVNLTCIEMTESDRRGRIGAKRVAVTIFEIPCWPVLAALLWIACPLTAEAIPLSPRPLAD